MKILPTIIDLFAKRVLGKKGGVYFEGFKHAVQIAESSDLKGEDKAKLALEEFKKFGYSLTMLALNVGIELAVMWLTATLGKVKIEK